MVQGSQAPAFVQELLLTKIRPPRLRAQRVARTRLLAHLDNGQQHKLTLISAPAGYGKSTLVADWIAVRSQRGDRLSVAWVSLDEGDNDPVRFWRYVFTACQELAKTGQAGVGEAALSMLRQAEQPSFEGVLTAFINDLTRLEPPAVLVLEDYHAIDTPAIHKMVAFLLDYMPPALHLMLITRHDPPLPLARLRAQHEIYELRAADLCFSPPEVHAFLQQSVPFPLPGSAATRLMERTEGWVAGLQLAALMLQRSPQPQAVEDFLQAFTGSRRQIVDYLAEEVLAVQPSSLQTFLLKTSILHRLNPSLCNALTGGDDGDAALEQLERANLFLLPLDGDRQWYRYHPLFGEAMQQIARRRLGETMLLDLYRRASGWHEAHGYLGDAVEMALSAQDYIHAADLIARTLSLKLINRELYTARRWLEQLPRDLLYERPALCFSYAMAVLFTSDRSAPETLALVQEPLQRAEARWLADENEDQLGQLLAFRALVAFWQGDFAHAFATARQSLELLPSHDVYWRGNSLFHIALAHFLDGQIEEAHSMVLAARSLWERAGNGYGVRAATLVLADLYVEQGELHQARRLLQSILDEAGEDRIDQGHALLGLAMLAYEWNDLERAEALAAQSLQISREYGAEVGEQLVTETLLVPAMLMLARVDQARGDFSQALERIQGLPVPTRTSPLARIDVQGCQLRLALAMGDVAVYQRPPMHENGDCFPRQQEQAARLAARVMIARNDGEGALRLLAPWHKQAHGQGRTGSELEILALMALAYAIQGDHAQAREAIEQSLALAQPGAYQRLFLDEGAPMAALLRAVYPDLRDDLPLAAYIRKLLLAFAGEPSLSLSSPPNEPILIEPLSRQEEQVLRLLAAGLSNPEIARQQVVSVNTIKSQLQSIYRKLDVHGRQEAVDMARRLGLL